MQTGRALAAVILAGGRSSRMGTPKASLSLGGTSLLAHVVARAQSIVAEIVIVAAPDQELPPIDAPAGVSLRIVRDRLRYRGPLQALAHGLAAVSSPAAFALGCDAPFLAPPLLDLLACDLGDAEALIPIWNDRPQPLVAVYKRTLLPAIDALLREGETRLQALAQLPTVRVLDPDRARAVDPQGMSFATLNTPQEYAEAIRFLESTRR